VTPTFFRTPASLRRWFKAHHATSAELWIGFYKKDSGRGGVVYRQALDEAGPEASTFRVWLLRIARPRTANFAR